MRRAAAPLALLAAILLAPAVGHGATVTATAPGIAVPDSSDNGGVFTVGEGSQTFTLGGKKVKKRRILDVNVTLNATSAAGADSLEGIRVKLIGPNGDEAGLPFFQNINGVRSWVNLKVDDQSLFFGCDPQDQISSRCNYVQGGTATGSVHGALNPVFGGGNPKGTWRLAYRDTSFSPPADPPTAIGTATLEVKTGKRFAKEGK